MKETIEAISWPHAALIFAIVFIFVFKAPLVELIRRTKKINKDGLETEGSPESQQAGPKNSSEAVQQLLDTFGSSIVISEYEEMIKQDLNARGLTSDQDCKRVLLRHLAGTQVLLAFEIVHSKIFGSQILLLKNLNEVLSSGRDAQFIEAFITKVKETHPALSDCSNEEYLSFLFSHLLVTSNNNTYRITNFGVEYLTWITRSGKSENNPL